MTTIGQRRGPDMPELARRAIELGDVSDRAVLDADLGDSPARPGREQDGIVPDPCAARIRRGVANDAHRVARELEHLQLAPAKKPIDLLFGDQNGALPFSVPVSIRAALVSRGLSQMARRPAWLCQAANTMWRLSGEIAGGSFRICHWSGRSMTTLVSSGAGPAARRTEGRRDAHQELPGRCHANPDSRTARPPCRGVLADAGGRGVARLRLLEAAPPARPRLPPPDRRSRPARAVDSRGVEWSRRIAAWLLNRSAPHASGSPLSSTRARSRRTSRQARAGPGVFATDHLAWAFEQRVQEGQRLVRQAVRAAFAPQVSRLGLELEWSEAEHAWRGQRVRHGGSSGRPMPIIGLATPGDMAAINRWTTRETAAIEVAAAVLHCGRRKVAHGAKATAADLVLPDRPSHLHDQRGRRRSGAEPPRAPETRSRTVAGTLVDGDIDIRTLRLALEALPRRPGRIVVVDADAVPLALDKQTRDLDAFVPIGSGVIYLRRESGTLIAAEYSGGPYLLMLAAVIWHEMAHAEGLDERQAQQREEDLWKQFVQRALVDSGVGLAYLDELRRRR